jgi:hypothetical protein
MPHVKIAGALAPAALFERLRPFQARDESGVQKIESYFLEQEDKSILAEALVADGGLPRHFFISLRWRGDHLTLRCLPATDPEKTEAVKRLVARLALRVRDCCPGARLAGDSLPEQIAALAGESGSGDAN